MKTKIFFGQSIATGVGKAVIDMNKVIARWLKRHEVRIISTELDVKTLASPSNDDNDVIYFYVTIKVDYVEEEGSNEMLAAFFGQSMDNGAASAIPYIERCYAEWREKRDIELLETILETAPVAILCKGKSKVYYYAVLLVHYQQNEKAS